jgi:hypothetical protein
MISRSLALLAVVALLVGCSSAPRDTDVYSRMLETGGKQPYRAALYMSPEIETAHAAVTTASGEQATMDMGDYLRTELIRATGRAFQGVVVVSEPGEAGQAAAPLEPLEIWPRWKSHEPVIPDLVILCYPMEMDGHVIPGGNCAHCTDRLSYRVELFLEIRSNHGETLFTGKVTGQGVEGDDQSSGELPLAARFRTAVAEAVDEISNQYYLALAESDIKVPPTPVNPEPDQVAETDGDTVGG